jgi:hypothetical protein
MTELHNLKPDFPRVSNLFADKNVHLLENYIAQIAYIYSSIIIVGPIASSVLYSRR